MKLAILLPLLVFPMVKAWGNEELEIFDLVEEVNQVNKNFYEYMEITNDASTSDVKRAYRKMSLILHPDRNSADDADEKFRWLASIYEILKDPERRAIYDRVLVEGLPDWRMPIYYYRRMRKMGLAEGIAYTFVIVTICQYFVNWAAYWEKKFTLKENISHQLNKKRVNKKVKKSGNENDNEELADKIVEEELRMFGPKPTCYDTLPFQLIRFVKYMAVTLPQLPSNMYTMYKEKKEREEEETRLLQEEEEDRKRKEAEKKERKERQKQKKMETKLYKEKQKKSDGSGDEEESVPVLEDVFSRPANALQMWTDDDLAKLTKLIKKFPGGTPERWEKIAEILERLPWEVTKMAQKVKDNSYMIPVSKSAQGVTGLEAKRLISDDCLEAQIADDSENSSDSDDSDSDYGGYSVATKEDYVPVEVKTKTKTKGGKLGDAIQPPPVAEDNQQTQQIPGQDGWNQPQQKALEAALQQFPKGTSERWDRIAGKVQGKSKEECMLRVRYLAEIVKKKKETEDCPSVTEASS